jgi:hypothetical protein
MVAAKPVIMQAVPLSCVLQEELTAKSFVYKMQNLLDTYEQTIGRENKMKVVLEIYQTFNRVINKFIKNDNVSRWVKYLYAMFNKSIEFEKNYQDDGWHEINEQLVENVIQELNLAKNFIVKIITNYNDDKWSDLALQIKNKFAEQRPRRNIKRVNYTGMDIIQPKYDDEIIANIWSDLTITSDPDYEFEEDKDDEEYEDDEDDEVNEENDEEELNNEVKTELKQYLTQLVDNYRVRRNVARVNYAGMDMSEEDEGQIHIAKRRFEDGKVKYIWKSYSLSQANEIEDEDYVDEA